MSYMTTADIEHIAASIKKLDNIHEMSIEELGEVLALLIGDLDSSLKTELEDLASRFSDYLDNSTGGYLSKTSYDVQTMISYTDSYYEKLHAEDLLDMKNRAELAESSINAVRNLAESYGPKPWTELILEALDTISNNRHHGEGTE